MTTTKNNTPKAFVRKTVQAKKGAYLENKHWQQLEALKAQAFLGRLVVLKTDKMPEARVGIVCETAYKKGQNVGNTFVKVCFANGDAVEINWRDGGYNIRLATAHDFVDMFSGLSEAPSVDASEENIEDMLMEVKGLNEAADIPEVVVEDPSVCDVDFGS